MQFFAPQCIITVCVCCSGASVTVDTEPVSHNVLRRCDCATRLWQVLLAATSAAELRHYSGNYCTAGECRLQDCDRKRLDCSDCYWKQISPSKYAWLELIFNMCLTLLECGIANGGSLRPSVCPSVALVIHAQTVQDVKINFAPCDRVMFLVSWSQISCSWDLSSMTNKWRIKRCIIITRGSLPNECVKERKTLLKGKIWALIHNNLETVQDSA